MATIINTKLGEHRGKRRIWLEGQKLAREGYEPGMKYDVEFKDSQVQFHICDTGRYTVSKRTRNGRIYPIIDLSAEQLAEIFDGVEMLRVALRRGRIVVTAHHQELLVKERVERLVNKLQNGEPLATCSLFHGGGVIDSAIHKGLESAGIDSKIAVAVELEGKYLDSSLTNNPQLWDDASVVIESPIQSVNLGRSAPQVDLLFGGVPCTGASRSGRSKGKLEFAESHESAGAMFFSFLRFVEQLNPAIVVMENVPEYQNTASMEVIRSVLGTLGYHLHEDVFNGNEFGALENRNRFCMIAVSKGISRFDMNLIQPTRKKEACLNDILDDVPLDSNRWKGFEYLAEKEKRDKAAGKGFARQLLTGTEDKCGTIGRGYAKCRSTEPFLVHPENPDLSRIFTPNEHARLKGIPEGVIDGLSDKTAHEILGQSVIFPVFEAVGHAIGTHLWHWLGYKTVQVEVVDEDQPCIGGDDFHWAPALVDSNGRVKLTPLAQRQGMPISLAGGKNGSDIVELAIHNSNGTSVSSFHQPCDYVPARFNQQGELQVQGNLLQ